MSIIIKLGQQIKKIHKEHQKKTAYKKAAESVIEKKAQAAYYRAKEKEAVLAAAKRAKAEYSPAAKAKQANFGQTLNNISESMESMLGSASGGIGYLSPATKRKTVRRRRRKK